MLRVGLDTSALTLTRAGTARYLTHILDGLEADPELELRRYDWGGDGKATRVVRDTGWYRFTLPRAAQRDGVQVLHCPTMRAPFRSRVPLVVTIHDAAVLRHPDAFNRWTRTYSAKSLPRVVRAADRIVVGSAFTGDELVELLSVPASKISVIPYGVGPPFAAEGPAAEGEYLLAVSTLEPRKNLARLLEGFRRSGLDGLELRVVGAKGWGDVSVEGERVRQLSRVDDDELARLYRGAAAVAYVSLYEGFGLPVLEAMACARPVVAPTGRPFSEFAHGVAFEVDPRDPDSIADGLRRAVTAGTQAVGAQRAADYSWERAVKAHADLYRELAG
jgi:glycosyltransferase involved in cell wall biosynthesis